MCREVSHMRHSWVELMVLVQYLQSGPILRCVGVHLLHTSHKEHTQFQVGERTLLWISRPEHSVSQKGAACQRVMSGTFQSKRGPPSLGLQWEMPFISRNARRGQLEVVPSAEYVRWQRKAWRMKGCTCEGMSRPPSNQWPSCTCEDTAS